jgi:hypothetical protein
MEALHKLPNNMDENPSVAPATNEGQEQELEINLDAPEESVEALKEKLAKEQEARRQLTARAKAAEEALKKVKPSTPAPTPEPVDKKGYDLDEVTDLRLDGYSKDEVKFIMNNGGRKALEDNTFVKVAIEKIREQKKAEQAIPAEETGKSEIERKYTQEQLRNMSADELYKILPKAPSA